MKSEKITFGIELEFSLNDREDWENLRQVITEKRIGTRWELTTDGSVSGYGSELRTRGGNTIKQILSDFKKLQPAIQELEKSGALYIDETAGFHIHLGIENWTIKELNRFFKLFTIFQNDFYSFQPKTRQNNRFCSPIRTSNIWSELDANDRYKNLNCLAIKKHSTLELRLFAGTVCYWNIKNILEIVNAFTKRALQLNKLVNNDSILPELLSNKKLILFFVEKMKKFNPVYYNSKKDKINEILDGLKQKS
jgi:hypothetical protein